MNTPGPGFRTIWLDENDPGCVRIIDQRLLPHRYLEHELRSHADGAHAIGEMLVRGAPLIGATAAWSLYLAGLEAGREGLRGSARTEFLKRAAATLEATRPTAVNLHWALDRMRRVIDASADDADPAPRLKREAEAICDEDVEISRRIGEHGLELIAGIAKRRNGEPVNILTHCNAGALATINWGTATAPMYLAQQRGIPIHVWVDETRPRNQGALTAWELAAAGIDHTVIVDNAGGLLMQRGQVDLCITGTDRTTRTGDVANKIGTYLKALAASDNNVPFYVALPSTTIDWSLDDGARIPIEERADEEVTRISGMDGDNHTTVRIYSEDARAANHAFDITPARLVTGLITERGICEASEHGLAGLFPERASEPRSA